MSDNERYYGRAWDNAEAIQEHVPSQFSRHYTITVIALDGSDRTVAVVSDFGLADCWLRCNHADLHEFLYVLAVVEELELDHMYGGFGRERYWYAWLHNAWRPIKTPECFENICGYGIG